MPARGRLHDAVNSLEGSRKTLRLPCADLTDMMIVTTERGRLNDLNFRIATKNRLTATTIG